MYPYIFESFEGKKLVSILIPPGKQSIVWNPSDLDEGIYIAKHVVENKVLSVAKMVLIN